MAPADPSADDHRKANSTPRDRISTTFVEIDRIWVFYCFSFTAVKTAAQTASETGMFRRKCFQ
jgi:hypothetical protein